MTLSRKNINVSHLLCIGHLLVVITEGVGLCNWTWVGCNTRPEVSAFLGNWSGDGGTLHFTLVVDNYARIVLKVYEHPVAPSERFTLPNNDSGHNLERDKVKITISQLSFGMCWSLWARKIVCGFWFQRTFFLNSGLPFFTVATNMSPTPAAGNLFKRPRMPWTAMTYKFLPPEIQCENDDTKLVYSAEHVLETFAWCPHLIPHIHSLKWSLLICTMYKCVLHTCIVGAVDDGTNWQTQWNAEFSSGGTSTSCKLITFSVNTNQYY